MQNQFQFAQAATWISAWIIAYFAIGLALAWKVIPKWHLSAMRKYVEIQYDYYVRITKEPGVPESMAAEYRKQMRVCAANGEALKRDLPKVPFSRWCLTWPMEVLICLRIESMSAKARKRIRSWDAKRAS